MSPQISPVESVYQERVLTFVSEDGLTLNVINIRSRLRAPSRCSVLLVHGAGGSADIFRGPVSQTIVAVLVEAGYGVWLENWRRPDTPTHRHTDAPI